MKSIKEKTEEVFPFGKHDSLETKLQRQKMRLCYEHGANYVLEEIDYILMDKDLDCEEICDQLIALIKQLKK